MSPLLCPAMNEMSSVCHALLQTPAFFSLLRRIDEDLMQSAQDNGYCHCGQPPTASCSHAARRPALVTASDVLAFGLDANPVADGAGRAPRPTACRVLVNLGTQRPRQARSPTSVLLRHWVTQRNVKQRVRAGPRPAGEAGVPPGQRPLLARPSRRPWPDSSTLVTGRIRQSRALAPFRRGPRQEPIPPR